jgi:hypothetical protein
MLTLRRAVVVLGALACCSALAVASARAELERRALASTRAVLDLPAQWLQGPPRVLALNGAHFVVSTGRSDLALPALLDHAQANCRASSGGLAARLSGAGAARSGPSSGLRDGVLRAEDEREGVVACLGLGAAPLSGDELVARLERFSRRLDLAELGGVTMVRVEARQHGSFFVVAASQGALPLGLMFPSRGDAPGFDPSELPRPPATRRLLSAHQADREPALFVYESGCAPDELWDDYLRTLSARGWSLADPAAGMAAPRHAALVLRGGRSAVVVVEPRKHGARLALLTSTAGSR